MASYNRVILAGNLTRDPRLSYTPSNTAVCDLGLAVNRKWRDRDGNQKDEVCYVDLTAYGRQAETLNQYMSKGRPLLVEGRLRFRQWTDKEGQNRNRLDVVVENFQFLGPGGGAGGGGGRGPSRSEGPSDDVPPPSDEDVPPVNPDIPF